MKNAKTLLASVLVAVAGLAAVGAAQAQSLYAGVAYTSYNFSGDGTVGAIKPSAATFKVGYAVSPSLAIEGRIAVPMGSDGVKVAGISVDGKVDSLYGIYAKGMLPVNEMFSAYGLLGFNDLSLKASSGNFSATTSKNGASYGLGLDVAISREISLNAEWVRNFSDVSGLSFGVAYKF